MGLQSLKVSIYGLQLAMKTVWVSVLSRAGSLSCAGQVGLSGASSHCLSLTSFSVSCMTQISGNSKGNQRVEAVKHERDALFLVNDALLDDLSPKNA